MPTIIEVQDELIARLNSYPCNLGWRRSLLSAENAAAKKLQRLGLSSLQISRTVQDAYDLAILPVVA